LSGRERRLAFLAAVGWVLYGVAAAVIVPAAPFWPASGLNQRWIWTRQGSQSSSSADIACAIAIAIWGIWGQQRILTVSSVRYTGFVHRQFVVTAAAMFLLSGWGLTEYFGVVHKDQLRGEAQGELDLLAASLSGETAPADGVVRLLAGAPTVGALPERVFTSASAKAAESPHTARAGSCLCQGEFERGGD
jgi:hypothetical protein